MMIKIMCMFTAALIEKSKSHRGHGLLGLSLSVQLSHVLCAFMQEPSLSEL